MRVKHLISLVLLCVATQFCAKQTAPTGGPKDETPPKLLKSNPQDQKVHFNDNKIELTFDELIQLNNPSEQIIITPSLSKKPEITVKKYKVTLEFKSPLEENTTYNINFRESIADLTEKNIAPVKLAFSTGSHIDSLKLTGTITDILSNAPVKNYTVAAAVYSDTFNIFKHQASWLTFTDKEGKFSLENLKAGTYLLYALDDKSKNLKVDSRSERYGFYNEPITLTQNRDSLAIETFKLDAGPLKLISARPMFSYYNIKVSKSLTDYQLRSTDQEEHLFYDLDKDLTNIKVYNTLQGRDSLQIQLVASDSIQNTLDTLLYIKFNTKPTTKDKFQAVIENANYYTDKGEFNARVKFSKPVLKLDTDSVYIHLDSLTKINFIEQECVWNSTFTLLSITKKYKAETPAATEKRKQGPQPKSSRLSYNKFKLGSASALSVELDTLPALETSVKNITPEEVGTIHTKVETSENFVLQLLGKNFEVLKEVTNQHQYSFSNLPPGTYMLRLIIDKNNNGKWDAGNFLKKQLPEPAIIYYNSKGQKDINIKANWEVGTLLITY
jgi:uncharacterized protein (DUF2141 family)